MNIVKAAGWFLFYLMIFSFFFFGIAWLGGWEFERGDAAKDAANGAFLAAVFALVIHIFIEQGEEEEPY